MRRPTDLDSGPTSAAPRSVVESARRSHRRVRARSRVPTRSAADDRSDSRPDRRSATRRAPEALRRDSLVRIIAGSREGHRIAAPKGATTRPTGDRVREAAFNLIGPVDGAAVLDLFAGSGAMGLEALSRGAASASSSSPTARPAAMIDATSRSSGSRARGRAQRRRPGARGRGRGGQDATISCSSTRRTTLDPTSSRRLARYLPHVLADDGLARRRDRARVEPAAPARPAHEPPLRLGAPHPLRADDHRDLPRLVRPGDARPRRRDPPRRGDLRPRRRRRRPRAAPQADAVHASRSASRSSRRRSRDLDNVEVDVFSRARRRVRPQAGTRRRW